MRILYYELNELVNEERLLDSLISMGLTTELLLPHLAALSFFKGNEIHQKHVTQLLGHESIMQTEGSEIIPFDRIEDQIQSDASGERFSARTGRIINLLIQSSKLVSGGFTNAPAGISMKSLLALLAYTHGLDALNIGTIFTPALPLVSRQTQHSELVEAVYQICQARVSPAKTTGTAITWVAAAILAALVDFQTPPFRFLQKGNSRIVLDGDKAEPLHVVLGELKAAEKSNVLIQTNIDDMSPQLLSYVVNRLLEAGALDVYQTPIYMKKNRVGIQLNVASRRQDEAKLAGIILKETTTLGVNVRRLDHRYHAEVRMIIVETKYGRIPVKQKYLDGNLIQSKPEYEVTAKIASESQVSMDELLNEIADQLKNNKSNGFTAMSYPEEKK